MLQSGESDLDRHIASLVACHCDEWARTIGLNDASSQFREDISRAIRSCIEMLDAGNSKRPSEIRKELERVSQAAAVAAERLLRLHGALLALTPQYRKLLDDWHWGQECQAGKLDLHLMTERAGWVTVLGNRSWAMAQIIDKGGRPPKIGFQALVEGLLVAFKHATGKNGRVGWDEYRKRRTGQILKLVEAVLPSVEKIAESVQLLPLKFPATPEARAKYIYDMTRKGSKMKRAPRVFPKTSNSEQ